MKWRKAWGVLVACIGFLILVYVVGRVATRDDQQTAQVHRSPSTAHAETKGNPVLLCDYKPVVFPGAKDKLLTQSLRIEMGQGEAFISRFSLTLEHEGGAWFGQMDSEYDATASRLIAVTLHGCMVLFLRDQGMTRDGLFLSEDHKVETMFFPFSQCTTGTVFDSVSVKGYYESDPKRTDVIPAA